jgi:hypothetical protein
VLKYTFGGSNDENGCRVAVSACFMEMLNLPTIASAYLKERKREFEKISFGPNHQISKRDKNRFIRECDSKT